MRNRRWIITKQVLWYSTLDFKTLGKNWAEKFLNRHPIWGRDIIILFGLALAGTICRYHSPCFDVGAWVLHIYHWLTTPMVLEYNSLFTFACQLAAERPIAISVPVGRGGAWPFLLHNSQSCFCSSTKISLCLFFFLKNLLYRQLS